MGGGGQLIRKILKRREGGIMWYIYINFTGHLIFTLISHLVSKMGGGATPFIYKSKKNLCCDKKIGRDRTPCPPILCACSCCNIVLYEENEEYVNLNKMQNNSYSLFVYYIYRTTHLNEFLRIMLLHCICKICK